MTETRYHRQIQLDQIGKRGQSLIRSSRVALVGVGALGCTIADQLVRAGIGYLRLIDSDKPELSNIQRQMLIDENDVRKGTPKSLAAFSKLSTVNSEVALEPIVDRLVPENALKLLGNVDIVLDGTDNFETRYLINRVCVEQSVPWVFGGVLAASGMSFAVIPSGPCLQCALGPEPERSETPTTFEQGILSPVVSTIASLEVIKAFKIICGYEFAAEMVVVDLWKESMRCVVVEASPGCPVCGVSKTV